MASYVLCGRCTEKKIVIRLDSILTNVLMQLSALLRTVLPMRCQKTVICMDGPLAIFCTAFGLLRTDQSLHQTKKAIVCMHGANFSIQLSGPLCTVRPFPLQKNMICMNRTLVCFFTFFHITLFGLLIFALKLHPQSYIFDDMLGSC